MQKTAQNLDDYAWKWTGGVRCDQLLPEDQPHQTYQMSAAASAMKLYGGG